MAQVEHVHCPPPRARGQTITFNYKGPGEGICSNRGINLVNRLCRWRSGGDLHSLQPSSSCTSSQPACTPCTSANRRPPTTSQMRCRHQQHHRLVLIALHRALVSSNYSNKHHHRPASRPRTLDASARPSARGPFSATPEVSRPWQAPSAATRQSHQQRHADMTERERRVGFVENTARI